CDRAIAARLATAIGCQQFLAAAQTISRRQGMSRWLDQVFRCTMTAVLAVGISGCATTEEITRETNDLVSQQWGRLDSAAECCSALGAIDFNAPTEGGLRFQIAEGNARVFESGKSYFFAMNVSEFRGSEYLVVKSHQNVHRRHGLPYIFRPSVLLVDENRQIAADFNIPLCFARGWTQRETGYFGLVKTNPAIWGAVFHTPRSVQGTSVKFGNSVTTAGGGAVVDVVVDYDFPASPIGELEVFALDPKLRSHLEKHCERLFQ
ncbi:MAG: hypothetical protein KDI51_12955, partial [Xanthomonadales bacterium]|nr:hypothetical protein [Xanthomonadales bacterium]